MKVCMLTTSFPRYDGDYVGRVVCELSRRLASSNEINQIHVVAPHTPNTPRYETAGGVRVHRFRYALPPRYEKVAYGFGIPQNIARSKLAKIELPLFVASFMAKAIMVSIRCDVVHAHWIFSGLIAAIMKRIIRKPIVLTVHGTALREFPAWLSRFVIRQTDAIVSPHPELTALLHSLGAANVVEIPNPIDLDKFGANIDSMDFRQEFALDEEQQLITFVARLEEFRDPLTFVRAIPRVVDKHSNVRFLIVGDGTLRPEAEKLSDELGLAGYLLMTGIRSDVHIILNASTVFAALSPYENLWCSALQEAMQVGVPCIVTKSGYSERLLTHKKDAYLVSPRSHSELAEAINVLLESKELRERLSKNAKSMLVERGFSPDRIVNQMIEVYHRAIASLA